ncbi:MAG: glycosyltransferase family 4 protein [Fibrobacteria bacterium]
MIAPAARPLRIFFIVENDQPHESAGGFYALYKFAEFLARRGHVVRIYGVHDRGWVAETGNLSLLFRPSVSRTGRLTRWLDRRLSRLAAQWILPAAIRRFRPDWIAGVLTYSAIKAEAMGRRFDIPVANFIYECPPWMREVLGAERFDAAKDAFSQRLWEDTRRAYLGSQVLFPNSDLSRDYNSRWLEGKAVAEPIHPGVDPSQMPRIAAGSLEPLPLDPARKHVLFVGRLAPGKNADALIRSFRKLPPDAQLHLCGTGPDRAALQESAAGANVTFHGYVPDEELWSLFRQCDLVVYPSAFEGFGMPPMQALYFGKACLASDLPILRSVYGDLLDYFPPDDEDGLAASMARLLADEAYRGRRGDAGHRYVLDHFTWERAADRIGRVLRESLAGTGAVR